MNGMPSELNKISTIANIKIQLVRVGKFSKLKKDVGTLYTCFWLFQVRLSLEEGQGF